MSQEARRDWLEWHHAYDDPASSLSRRLHVVQSEFRAALDARRGATTVISMCAGQGRDVLPVLAAHPRKDHITALLVEFDPRNVETARQSVRDLGLARVRVLQGDAGLTDSYAGAVPADVVLACGVFGNIADEHVRRTIEHLPSLCAPAATVLWTRGRENHRDYAQDIRHAFTQAGFAEVGFHAPDDAKYRVGVCRLTTAPRPLERGLIMFRFTR